MGEDGTSDAVATWLDTEIESAAKEYALTALLAAVGAVLILVGLHWFFGDVVLFVLLGTAVSYGLFGGFRADRTVLRLPGSVGTHPGAPGSRLNPDVFDFWLNLMRLGLRIGAGPAHLMVVAWRAIRKRSRVISCNRPLLCELVTRIVNAGHAVECEVLAVEMGFEEHEEALLALGDLRGAVFLSDPKRVTLTDPVLAEIPAA